MQGIIFNIRRYSVQDGPGIRTTVFLKGCHLHCLWCHNPESQAFQPEIFVQPELCIHCGRCYDVCPQQLSPAEPCLLCGACVENCPAEARVWVGEYKDSQEIVSLLIKDTLFYDESGGGVTFSGGEPLSQPEFLLELLQGCGQEGIHRAVDTSGYAPWSILQPIAEETDLFLFDLKLMDPQAHLQYTGVDNQQIMQNLHNLMELGYHGIVRMPLIPGINNQIENLEAMAEFMVKSTQPWPIQILPYHHMQIGKYEKMGRPYLLPDLTPPTHQQIQEVVDFFRAKGLQAERI